MAEKFDTEKIIADTNLVELVSRWIPLTKSGNEYKGLCPFHVEKSPSFTVSPTKQFYHCFGCGAHNNAIGFLMEIEGIDFVESCKRLLNGSGTGLPDAKPVAQRELKKPPPRKTYAPPQGTAPLGPDDMVIKSVGPATSTHPYITATGDTLGWAAFYPDKPEPRYWTFGRRTEADIEKWERKPFSDPTPLYGLMAMARRPKAQVLICGNERAADAAEALFPGMVAITWPGGSSAVKLADWSPLTGRQVVLWPGADAPGIECMGNLAMLLQTIASEIKGLRVDDMPPAWDAANWADDMGDPLAWAKPRVFTYQNDVPVGGIAATSPPVSPTMPDMPVMPLEAYSEADASRTGADTDHEPPTQPAPPAAKLVGIYDNQATGPKPTAASLGVVSRRMSDVTIRAVDWLWYGKIPCGKVTGISGNPGLGKSQITASLAAVVSTGGKWPVTREQAQLGSVLLLNAEDDADDTLGPRLIAAGADLTRIHIIDAIRIADERGYPVNRGLDLVRDIERIAIKINEIGDVRLVIIDPASAYMGTADSHKMADVVGIMSRLKSLASASKCAIIMVNHLNKSSGQDALLKTQGSIGFVSHARAVWGVCKDKDDSTKRYFVPLKNNLGPDSAAASLSYRIEEFHLADSDPPIVTSRIMWDAELVTQSAQELMQAHDISQSGERGVNAECEDFLRDLLQYGAVPVKEIELAARKAGLHLNNTMRAVKARLGITSTKRAGLGGEWVWQLPEPKTGRGSYGDRDR